MKAAIAIAFLLGVITGFALAVHLALALTAPLP